MLNDFVDVLLVIPAGKKVVVIAWLNDKGVVVNKDSDGIELTRGENMIGAVCTDIEKDFVTKELIITIRLTENAASKLPDHAYIVRRSDDPGAGELPIYNVTATQTRTVARIS